jgi:CRISPR-associated endonuclease Csn1
MEWRLGGDLGTNSLGTAAFSLEKGEIDDLLYLGSRIFPDGRDPKSLASSNMDRRAARLSSRGFERKRNRKVSLLVLLTRLGLAPIEQTARRQQAALDPYPLRKKALDHDLTATEFGRVLMNLNHRRGFKSSRLDAEEDDDDLGLIASGIDALESAMAEAGSRTLGEYLHQRRLENKSVRARSSGTGKDKAYAIYPSRALIQQEFTCLWARQAPQLGLTDDQRDAVQDRIFHQRPLKPMIPGKCTFLRDQLRAAKAQPLAQRFEIVQKVNNLRFDIGQGEQSLLLEQRLHLIESLARQGEMTFAAVRKALKLPRDARINLESDTMKKLPGSVTAKRLSAPECFGEAWWSLSDGDQRDVVTELQSTKEADELAAWFGHRFGLSPEQSAKTSKVRLPQGHLRLSLAALEKIVPVMERGEGIDKNGCVIPLTYDKAVEQALGLNHSIFSSASRFDRLPYYGVILDRFCVGGTGEFDDPDERRYGRIPNPTVHVALNQVRVTVNELIERFGQPPAEVVLEIGRELPMGAQAKRDLAKEQSQNQKANVDRDDVIRNAGMVPSAVLRLKLRLWEELDARDPLGRCCVYTGRHISLLQALSAETEIDHILPYRLTLDDSAANKVLVFREANRRKARRTPHGAFGPGTDEPGISPWDDITIRARRLGRKSWRFSADAMDIFEKHRDFLDRQLVDMQYISRLARDYISCLFDKDGSPVWVIPGRLTAMIRGKLGLNKLLSAEGGKNRDDHRHHAVDAFVAGVTSRSFLQRIATAAARADDEQIEKLLADMPSPYAKFEVAAVQAMVDAIVVSHKVDHGRNGQLHEETAYGIVDPKTHDGFNLVRRKPVTALSDKEIDRVLDETIRASLREAVPAGLDKKAMADALMRFSRTSGIVRVKVLVKEANPVAIKDRDGKPYKAVIAGDVQRIDVWLSPGETVPEFIGVSRFDANQKDLSTDFSRALCKSPNKRGAKKIMSIFKGDTLAINEDGERRLMKVVRMSPVNRRLLLLQHNISGGADNAKILEQYQFSTLVRLGFRKVHVSPTGVVKDGGPRLPFAAP